MSLKPARNTMCFVQAFIGGNRKLRKRDVLDCIQQDPSPTAALAEHLLAALRIRYYLEYYHGLKISDSTVSSVLKAPGLSRLPSGASAVGSRKLWRYGATKGELSADSLALRFGKSCTDLPNKQEILHRALQNLL